GQNIPAALGSTEAAQIRLNNRLNETSRLAGDFANTFVQGMIDGQNAVQALGGSLSGLGQSLTKFGTQQIGKTISTQFESLLGGLGGLGGFAPGGLLTVAVGCVRNVG